MSLAPLDINIIISPTNVTHEDEVFTYFRCSIGLNETSLFNKILRKKDEENEGRRKENKE